MLYKKVLLFLFFVSFVINGQTHHTINIDGNNDFRTQTEKFNTTSVALLAYVTFDNSYLYLGFSGSTPAGNVTDNGRAYHLYIDSDPQENPLLGTGSTSGDAWRWNPTLPFTANYHFAFKTETNEEVKRLYTAGSWGNATFETGNWKNTTSNFWEVRIKLSDIGNPAKLLVVAYVEEDWDIGSSICGGLPSGLFTNTTTQGNITFNNTFLGLEIRPGILPNADYNLNNSTFSSWDIKLSASTTSLNDNVNHAGMGYFATDSFDTLIDLPKPGVPPSNYLQLYFEHNDWSTALGPFYSEDFKKLVSLSGSTSTWTFKVNTDKTNEQVTITASEFGDIPAGYDIKLKDLTTSTIQDLRTNAVYTYNSGVGGIRTFELTIGVAVVQNISVVPTSLSYGNVLVDSPSSKNVKIYNTGNGNLSVTNIVSSNSAFAFSGGTTHTITPGDSVTVQVTFTPTAAIVYADTLTITSDDPDQSTIEVILSGTGFITNPNISVNPTTLAFGNVTINTGSSLNFKVYNSGDANLSITNIQSSNSVFTFTGGTTYTVTPNDSVTIPVTFTPTTATAYTDSITITSNDPDQASLKVRLTGTGTALQPALSLNPTSLAFPNIAVGDNNELVLTVSNTGQANLNVTNIIIDNGVFQYSGETSFTVAPAGNKNMTVLFVPTLATSYTGKLKIVSNDPTEDTTVVNLSGTGTESTLSKTFLAGWNLMSSPLNPNNPLASVTIGSSINPFYLFGYNATSGYVLQDTVLTGKGYWLGIEDTLNLSITGIGSTGNISKDLSLGWNLAASPFNDPIRKSTVKFTKGLETISADSAVTRGWIQNAYYGYSNVTKTYSLSDTLKLWAGYWFASLTDGVKMKFDEMIVYGKGATDKPEVLEPNTNSWNVNILAKISGASDNLLNFGTDVNATDNFDAKFDLAKPPVNPSNTYINTYFDNSSWNTVFSKFAYDIKKAYSSPEDGKSWSFNVVSNKAGVVELSWEEILNQIPQVIQETYGFTLSGFGINGSLNMLTVRNYSFQAEANAVYTFVINSIITGVEDEKINDFSYNLQQNYPNPFNPSTIISFSVPEQSFVTLKVYDILGNEIKTLVNSEVSKGMHQLTFDASGLSSGVYFYTIKAGKFTNTKKLILTK